MILKPFKVHSPDGKSFYRDESNPATVYAAPQPSQPVEAGETFDAMKHQTLLGYDASGDAIFGTDPEALARHKASCSAVVLDDERAAFVKAVQSLTFLCRTETKRLDAETLKALDTVEDHLVALRESTRDDDGELRAASPQLAQTERALTLPAEAVAWFEARQAFVEAVRVYNERVKLARSFLGSVSVDAEYQAMNAAQRKAGELIVPMYDAIASILTAAQPASGENHE